MKLLLFSFYSQCVRLICFRVFSALFAFVSGFIDSLYAVNRIFFLLLSLLGLYSGFGRLLFAKRLRASPPTSPASSRLCFCRRSRTTFQNSASLPISTCVSARGAVSLRRRMPTLRPRLGRSSDMAVSGRNHVEALVSHQNPARRGKCSPNVCVCLAVTSVDLGGRGLGGGQVSLGGGECIFSEKKRGFLTVVVGTMPSSDGKNLRMRFNFLSSEMNHCCSASFTVVLKQGVGLGVQNQSSAPATLCNGIIAAYSGIR